MRDRAVSVVFILFSFLLCAESYRLQIGTYRTPGAGFLPFGVGLLIGILALILMIRPADRKGGVKAPAPSPGKRWQDILRVLAFLFLYALLLEKIGFVLATFLFMVALLKWVESKSWPAALVTGSAVAGATYLVFEIWLQTQLPRGVLG